MLRLDPVMLLQSDLSSTNDIKCYTVCDPIHGRCMVKEGRRVVRTHDLGRESFLLD